MRRPGNLNGFTGHLSRASRRSIRSGFGDLGGKAYAPLPTAPGTKTVDFAINSKTKKYYQQDTRCPEGETMKLVPCVGADCDPGEMENDCADDPFYLEFPETKHEYCIDVKRDPAWRRIPRNMIDDYCKRQDMDETPPAAAQRAAPKAAPKAAAPQAAAPADDTAALAEELARLEAEEAATSAMPSPVIMPAAATYTGGGATPTGLPRRAAPSTPTSEQKLAALVSAHEEKRAMSRAGAPPPPIVVAPPPAARTAPAPARGIGGLFAKIRSLLFGTSPQSFSGLGQADKTFDKKDLLLLAAALGAAYYVYNNK